MAVVSDRTPMSEAERHRANTNGILAMLASTTSFVIGDACMKAVGTELPLGQMIFLRGLLATVLVLLLVRLFGAGGTVAKLGHPLVLTRTASEIGATLCFFSGLVLMPLADATAISQFAPLALTAAAAIFLSEPVGWRRWLATLVGLIGVLIIIKPGTSAFNWAALFIVGSVLSVTVRDILTRQIPPDVPAVLMTALAALAITLAGLALKPFEVWQLPSAATVGMLVVAAVGMVAGFHTIILAMRSGELSLIAPFRYNSVLLATLVGFFAFGEVPAVSTLVGIAIVVAAGLYTFHREHVRRRAVASPAGGRPGA
jgi:drug/metabolite transporter (DMT)-like permease